MEFKDRVRKMNKMYDLHVNDTPQFYGNIFHTIENFQSILSEEVDEATDIIDNMHDHQVEVADVLVSIADLLADIIIYCRSEAMKYGIPLEEVINIVMDSNESKLGEDGEILKDQRGKVLKGVNYWKPEPKIKELLLARIEE